MSKRRSSTSDRCKRCQVNYRFCFCEYLLPMSSSVRISIIMHAREANLSNNTARLAHLLLSNSEIRLRGEQKGSNELALSSLMLPGYRQLFLFPYQDAEEVNANFLQKNPGPYQIIVPDGSWRQAFKMKKREEIFRSLPAVKLPPGGALSAYRLRTEPYPEAVCTLEAIARMLGIIEGQTIQKHLEKALDIMVARVLLARSGDQRPWQ